MLSSDEFFLFFNLGDFDWVDFDLDLHVTPIDDARLILQLV